MSIKANLRARQRRRRILGISAVAVVVALLVLVYFVASINSSASPLIGKPVPSSLLQELTGVSDPTLNAVGTPSGVNPPVSITGSALNSGGKPEVLYIGGEFCPYCAVERWSLIVALSRFGTFQGLEYMESSSTDLNPNTPTYTFANVTYTSSYITFVPVEEFGRSGQSQVIQPLTSQQESLVSQYDTCASSGQSGGIPFVDIDNQYAINCGAQFTLSNTPGQPEPNIVGMNWTQIASVLNDPNSGIAQRIDGAANYLISAICKATGSTPASVCSQAYGSEALSYVPASPSQTLLAVPAWTAEHSWTD